MTVVSRTFASIPHRTAGETWSAIVELLAPNATSGARHELERVAGIASCLIADEALHEPMVMYGVRTRLRIYCVYGDDAIEQSGVNENSLSFDPSDGDWMLSLPCSDDDLDWVERALASDSKRVRARALGTAVGDDDAPGRAEDSAAKSIGFVVNRDSFFRS